MSCTTCELIQSKKGELLHEDPLVYVVLTGKASEKGHIKVFLKNHATALDKIGTEETQHFFQIGNLAATVLFETLGAHGTNLILNEGDLFNDHLCLDVVARKEGDKINTKWEGKEIPQEKIEQISKGIKDRAMLIGKASAPPEIIQAAPKENTTIAEENELVKHLDRLP